MTVSTEVDHNDYTGNGVTTSFPYTFRIFKKSDLVVQVVDLNENITALILDTDYTVTGAGGYTGGNVILATALESGYQISISRELPVTQETDLRNQGKFFAEVHEDAFDKLTMLIQQVRSLFSLALRKPSFVANYYDALGNYIRNLRDPSRPQDAATKNYVDSVADTNFGRTLRTPEPISSLPGIEQRKNKIVAMDNSGNPIMVLPESGSAADVLIELEKPTGAEKIGTSSGDTVQEALDNIFSTTITPEMFGDVNVNARLCIQSAIDFANENYINKSGPTTVNLSGHYIVGFNPASILIPDQVAAGRGCLCMKTGVSLTGNGVIELDKSLTGGESGAIITNWLGAADYCSITDITMIGNSDVSAVENVTSINILGSKKVVIENVKCNTSTGGGIYLRWLSGDFGCVNSKVTDCIITDSHYIGIQLQRPFNVSVNNNIITKSGDNAIDVESNVPASTGLGNSRRVSITNNIIAEGCLVGVFMESCGDANILGNSISDFRGSGVMLNRINSSADHCNISANKITGPGNDSGDAIRFSNSVGKSSIYGNYISSVKSAYVMNAGINHVHIGLNYLRDIGNTILEASKTPTAVISVRMESQYYEGAQNNDGAPYNTSPRGFPAGAANRFYLTSVVAPFCADIGAIGEDNFIRAMGILPKNNGWNAYALYNTIVPGETVVALTNSNVNAGEYLLIDGAYYLVYLTYASYSSVF